MATHTITAFFDSRAHADEAVVMLKQAGIAAADITLLPPANESNTYDRVDTKGKGFWGIARRPVRRVPRTMRPMRRDFVVVARWYRSGPRMPMWIAPSPFSNSMAPSTLDERETQWRSEGWTAETPLVQDSATTSGLSGVMGLGAATTGFAAPARDVL